MARILVIDDEELVRLTLRQTLENQDHEVVEAINGSAALKLQRSDPADLVITDLLMPEKEGIETIRELKQEFPAVKIIAISGGGPVGNTTYLAMSERFGAEATLLKPFEPADLVKAVERLLAEK
jgi:DNA-binding NarL/FixJ family response regulator